MSLFKQGRLGEAESLAKSLTVRFPQHGFAWKILSGLFHQKGRQAEALSAVRKVVELSPQDADMHCNLGSLLKSMGRFGEAEVSYLEAVRIKPDFVGAHYNLGNCYYAQARHVEAEACYRKALQIQPKDVDVLGNLAKSLKQQERFAEAEAVYHQALKVAPKHVESHYELGNMLQEQAQLDEAIASYRQALALKPDHSDAYSNLLLALNYDERHTVEDCFNEALHYGQMVSRKAAARFTSWQCEPMPKRLRVGVVSWDLRKHPVGHFLEAFLGCVDTDRIELIAYPPHTKEDELTVRIRPFFAQWKPLSCQNPEAAAKVIHADGVHVLLDLAGHTAHNQLPLFAYKPAPVQASWLGYFATTGMAEMDYFIGDPHVLPSNEQKRFREKVWRLPETYLCFTPPNIALEVNELPALTAGYVTFGCFNNLNKMTDAVVVVWANLLKATPNSRLFLKTHKLNEAKVCQITRQRFVDLGISGERLILEGASPRAELLAAYHRVDIALDPFPYPGGTTSVEALWMGVPVLTRQGNRFLSLIGESIVHNAGLPDWIAGDDKSYIEKAVGCSVNLKLIKRIRAELRQQVLVSPLFNAPRFARHFEAMLWKMWEENREM
jgi:predicted O-linked N-acetylglucosamine transferase (SPINDLY family)